MRLVLALAVSLPSLALAQADVADVESALALFDRIGLPSVAGKRLVIVNTGEAWAHAGTLRFETRSGWLLSEAPNTVDLLDRGMARQHIERKRGFPAGWQAKRVVLPPGSPLPGEIADLDFEVVVAKLLERTWEPDPWAPELSLAAKACLYAHWARQRGRQELVERLIDLAWRAKLAGSVEEQVGAELRERLRVMAIRRAGEGAPRLELLRRWTAIAGLSRGPCAEEVRRLVRGYAAQVASDRDWSPATSDELEAMPAEAQAAVWMHRLRDLALPTVQINFCVSSNVLGPTWDGPNPAKQLATLGWEVLPLVIEHMTDPQPTRTVGWEGGTVAGALRLLTVGDCCKEVFEAISGQCLDEDAEPEALQAAARAWWAGVQAKGARTVLVEAVAAGDAAAVRSAPLLAQRYREEVVPALRAGLSRAERDVRASLVWALVEVDRDPRDDAQVSELLRAEAASDRPLELRIAATHGLVLRGEAAALAPMIEAWKALVSEDPILTENLIALLATSGRLEAVRALGKDLHARPAWVQSSVVDALSGDEIPWWPGSRPIRRAPLPDDPAEVEALDQAIEEVKRAWRRRRD